MSEEAGRKGQTDLLHLIHRLAEKEAQSGLRMAVSEKFIKLQLHTAGSKFMEPIIPKL